MLEITDGSTGETIQVTDPEAIRYIADNLNAMGFSHAGTAEGAGWTYGLTWFDHQGKPFETIFLMGDGYTILYEGRYAKGMEADQEIDLAFVESLLANGRAVDWGIALSAVDVQPTGLTLVIAQSGGHPTGRLQYGSDYTLEVLQDGVWEQVLCGGRGRGLDGGSVSGLHGGQRGGERPVGVSLRVPSPRDLPDPQDLYGLPGDGGLRYPDLLGRLCDPVNAVLSQRGKPWEMPGMPG